MLFSTALFLYQSWSLKIQTRYFVEGLLQEIIVKVIKIPIVISRESCSVPIYVSVTQVNQWSV